jgi:hypothetical protein
MIIKITKFVIKSTKYLIMVVAIERYEEVHKPKKPRSVDTLRYCNAADNYPLRQRELVHALCAEVLSLSVAIAEACPRTKHVSCGAVCAVCVRCAHV